jgi:predicted  nucleic acid-binding Zn-ribbon protein
MTTELIRRTLQPLLDEFKKMDGIVSDLEEELAEAKGERKTVEKLLIDGGLIERPEPKASSNGKPKTGKDANSISEEMLDRAREAIETNSNLAEDEFKTADLKAAMGVAEATANKAIIRLRETGEVRLVGKRGQANYFRKVG